MRILARRAALLSVALLAALAGAPAAGADSASSTASSTAAPTGQAHQVPPPAPTPSSAGKSPDKPDPHPPVGGVGPNGELVGGAALASRGVITPASAPALPAGITAAGWVLADLDSGKILAAADPHGRYQPASILKTLTTLTLTPLLPGSKMVTVSQSAAAAEGSAVGLVAGGSYSVDQLFQSLLMVSGNDAAAALAEAAGGVAHTVELMNAKAMSLGAYDTFVQTPSGLDGWQQLTSAYDMTLVLRAAVNDPRFVAYDQTRTMTMPAQNVNGKAWPAFQVQNQGIPFSDAVPGALVSKIGFTDAAQHTYLAAVDRNGRRLGVVFMRAQRWPLDQWQQAQRLFDWGYALPASTPAVGHLDAAVRTPAQAAATSAALRAVSVTHPQRHRSALAGVLTMLVLGGITSVALWRRRRPAGTGS